MEPHYVGKPSYRIQYLLIVADLYAAQGDWEALVDTAAELTERVSGLELAENHQLLWVAYYQALLAVAEGDKEAYQTALATMQEKTDDDPVANLCLIRLQLWALRRGLA